MGKKYIYFIIALSLFCFCLFGAKTVFAYTIEELNFSNEGDIVVGPGKTELFLSPGDSYSKEIIVSNRSGVPKIIDISVEDFEGSQSANETIKFLGKDKSPYSLKDYVKPEIEQITLQHGQRLRLPVLVSVPPEQAPGGLYGAVMVSASNIEEPGKEVETGKAAGKVKIITRVASLFFIRVKGDVFEEGSLGDFKTAKSFYEKGPVTFQIIFENTGSVHLSPYGVIKIKNILGNEVGQMEIDPWFIMPKSVRTREVKWNRDFLFGRYTAELSLNRGYQDIKDTETFSFWIIPWRILSAVAIGLILLILLIVWVASHLQWRGKKETPPPVLPAQNASPPPLAPPPSV